MESPGVECAEDEMGDSDKSDYAKRSSIGTRLRRREPLACEVVVHRE
jgi:hypothetical protein